MTEYARDAAILVMTQAPPNDAVPRVRSYSDGWASSSPCALSSKAAK